MKAPKLGDRVSYSKSDRIKTYWFSGQVWCSDCLAGTPQIADHKTQVHLTNRWYEDQEEKTDENAAV